MSAQKSGVSNVGSAMDYAEHEKSYKRFITGTKYGTVIVVALLIAMAFSFFTAAGFFSGLILFFVLNAAGFFFLR